MIAANILEQVESVLSAHEGMVFSALLLAVGLLALAVVYLSLRVWALSRPLARMGEGERAEILPALAGAVEKNQGAVAELRDSITALAEKGARHLQGVGLVRYDAFDDVGGKQSYSICLLDGDKNGVIITYLTGRNSTRSYAVAVDSGEASRQLSDEEDRALRDAVKKLPL